MAAVPALSIVRRDLVRFARSPLRTALMFSIPLVMAAIFALVFGSGGSPEITVRVLVFNQDEGMLGRLIQGAGQQQPEDTGARLEVVPVGEEGFEMMENGEASALVHVPAGFSEDYLAGRPVTLEVVKNPSQAFLPQVVEEGVSLGAVLLSQASLAFRPELETLQGFFSEEGVPASPDVALLAAGINDRIAEVERYAFPPVLTFESTTAEREDSGDGASPWGGGSVSILSVFLPGLSVMGILFLAQAATRDILRERESGLLRHLLAAPVSVGDYLTGKCLSVLLVTAVGFAVLVLIGVAAGVSWGPPLAVAALVLATALGAAGTLLLLMSLVRTERQGDALTTIVIIVWSMVGGVFLPITQIPSFLLPISKSSLTYWATDGFLSLILSSGTLGDVLPNVMVLAGIGVLFVSIGVWRLHRSIAAGVR